MIISHKYKFIFIKTVKTAGTSIETYLSDICDEKDIFTPILPKVEGHNPRNFKRKDADGQMRPVFFNHIPARKVRKLMRPDKWNSYFKFCVERNPWDRTLSHFHMMKYRGKVSNLPEYLAGKHRCYNFPLYANRNDEIIVDRILRYENLDGELSDVFAELGVPFDGKLTVRVKSGYRTDHRHYREVLTPEQAEFLRQTYIKEVEHFGWEY